MSCAGPPEWIPQCAERVVRGRPLEGPKVIVGDGTAQRLAAHQAAYAHGCAAVAEGLCPAHRTVMAPVEMGDEVVAGHCSSCGRYWWYDTGAEEVGWMLDHDPHDGSWRPPYRGLA